MAEKPTYEELKQRVRELEKEVVKYKQTDEKPGESEQRFHSICENIPNIAVQGYNADRKVIFWNQASEKLYGYKKEEAIGSQLEDLIIPPEMREFVIETIKNWVENGILIPHGELELMHKNKTTLFVYSSHVMLKNIMGEVEMYCIDIDMTGRKLAEEAFTQASEKLRREHNQRKILSKSLIDLLEKDRRQISMELHDHIGQTLTSLKMNLEIIHGKLKPDNTELEARIAVAQKRTIQAIKDIRNVSHGLRPAMIEALGVVSSLRELFNEIQQQADIEIHFFSRGIPERFEDVKELALYRVAQEALTNIIRHARAKNIFVNLVKKDKKLLLSVEDNGVGFDQDKVMDISKKKGSLGLLIMRERAVQLDGEFTIESQPGKGTHVLVEIPI